jgi:stage III sporulation protein AA
LEAVFDRLPDDMARSLRGLPKRVTEGLEEIRFRVNRPVTVYSGGKEYEVERRERAVVSHDEMEKIFSLLMNHSNYAYQDEIKSGYITLDGGHRVGICGRVIMDGDHVVSVRDISSVNIRRGREHKGISDPIVPYLFDGSGKVRNTIILSPPKCGKTTVLRDLIRNISKMGNRVGVCDERSEIAGISGGVPGFDLGPRTDVMDGCPKDIGITMLIRSMSPDVIAVDELGSESDAKAVERAAVAGISLIATMHGRTYEDAVRSSIGRYIKNGLISRIVLLSAEPSPGTVEDIINSSNMSLLAGSEMKWGEV